MNTNRLLFLLFLIIAAFGAVVVRLVNIQIIKNEELKFYATRQQTSVEIIKAERGLIYDKNNFLLAYNRNDVSFDVYLKNLNEKGRDTIAKAFSSVTGKPVEHYLNLMSTSRNNICIEKKAYGEHVTKLKELKLNGLSFREDPTRVYQYNNLASHILGYVNTDYCGTEGIEKYLENELRGIDGRRSVLKDARNNIVTVIEPSIVPAESGNNVYLTIDRSVQSILEDELRKGVENFGASNGLGIVMNPANGEVLALANMEDFNPNVYNQSSDDVRRNKTVTDVYEPGSTFKSLSLASILDVNLCRLDESIFVENGKYKFKKVIIKDSHGESNLTVRQVFAKSSNIGLSKLSQRMDNESFYVYLRNFGFGNFSGIELPGEVKGTLKKPGSWSEYTKSSMSFGYEVAVTPIQLITAYASLINGGNLFKPTILKRVTNPDGNIKKENEPQFIRKVISESTSQKMRELLVLAVEEGTGKKAKISEIAIGGKTGTARQIVQGKYSKEFYNSSFIGFFPADQPKYLILIVVNSPSKTSYFGGDVAAPIFREISKKIIDLDAEVKKQSSPAVNNITVAFTNNNSSEVEFKNAINNTEVKYNTSNMNKKVMPDLTGATVREAIKVLTYLKVKYEITGSGRIVKQSIEPGTRINNGITCKLTCENKNITGVKTY